ncbi:hypothetical protein WMY93_020569 [Mugilogobius chulae]|uniref:Transmembrane protein 120B n=1 Tax=Mugilogobius chulae TaxID=88201 RepID=A0AAW0NCR3_9GOBI
MFELNISSDPRSAPTEEKELELLAEIRTQIKERENVFFDMEAYLPKRNGLYLNLVLGNVNVTLLSNQAKFAYKDEYEKFKLYLTIILLFGAITCLFFLNYRVTDEIFNFLLVWYYCTLTIRESILMSNGSRFNKRMVGLSSLCLHVSLRCHAYLARGTNVSNVQKPVSCFLYLSKLSTVLTVLLPERLLVQTQSSWGEKSTGSHSGGIPVLDVERPYFSLTVPLLGHFWQLYNSVTLFRLAQHEDCKEWQVFMLALTFLVLFLGNFLTTLKVVHQKVQKSPENLKKTD